VQPPELNQCPSRWTADEFLNYGPKKRGQAITRVARGRITGNLLNTPSCGILLRRRPRRNMHPAAGVI